MEGEGDGGRRKREERGKGLHIKFGRRKRETEREETRREGKGETTVEAGWFAWMLAGGGGAYARQREPQSRHRRGPRRTPKGTLSPSLGHPVLLILLCMFSIVDTHYLLARSVMPL